MDFDLNSPDLDKLDEIKSPDRLFTILLDTMRVLRSPRGCMWDREQDHKSLKKSLIEEAYETIEAIEKEDPLSLREELGDLMLQTVFHSQIADEDGHFNMSDVLRGIIRKLLRRHPHVFGDQDVSCSDEILSNWEDIKKKERRQNNKDKDSIFSGIPLTLPSLHFAYEVQNRASRLGFDWDNAGDVHKKILEELEELDQEIDKKNSKSAQDEMGDLLFSIINYSRHLGIDIEKSLKDTSRKFIERFKFMEETAGEKGSDFKKLSLEEKERLWEKSKKYLP
ncbi:MAG: nucleoside triphosphate pyrophosphohydrolase [Actinobacteria bacterium]|nr:nucleoside triphosphate pyrophosphohydrolase [Actinomycetota bacterium]